VLTLPKAARILPAFAQIPLAEHEGDEALFQVDSGFTEGNKEIGAVGSTMACNPTSDSCIWHAGVGFSGLCPAPPMKVADNADIKDYQRFGRSARPAPPSRTLSPA